MGTFSKVLKYKKPNLPVDKKIKELDEQLRKLLERQLQIAPQEFILLQDLPLETLQFQKFLQSQQFHQHMKM
jgi:hypothetical protein